VAAAGACLDTSGDSDPNSGEVPSYPAYVVVQTGSSYALPNGFSAFASVATAPPGIARVDLADGIITGIGRGFAQWDPRVLGYHPLWIAVLGQRRAQPILVGHHGVPYLAPENTLAGVNAACQLGIPGMEVDVRFSKDSVPVLMHDRDVRRTSNGTGYVDAMTFADLEQLDVGAWFSPSFAGERVPTVTDFLTLSALCGFDHIQLDMKSFAPLGVDSGMVFVGRALNATGLLARTFVASDIYTLRRGVALVPGMHTLVYGGVVTAAYADVLIQDRIGAIGVLFGDYAASSAQLARLESAGVLVGVWGPRGVLDLNTLTPTPRFVTSDWGWTFPN